MRLAFVVLLALHGIIHLAGFAKGFGLAEVSGLRLPVGRLAGALWLVAALGLLASATAFLVAPDAWWRVALPSLVLSQALIVHAWADARFGTVANVLALVPLALALLDTAPGSFQSTYRRLAADHLGRVAATAPAVTDHDLAPLPPAVQAWLRRVGVVGKPHVQAFEARWHGRFRRDVDAGWMSFASEQVNVVVPSSRVFTMRASLFGVPMDGLHVYTGEHARMQVRVASLLDVVDATGPEMDRGETVTILNDLCVMAPAALLDLPLAWTPLDDRSVRVTYTRGAQTVSADLTFDDGHDLVGFVSNDRYLSADGKTYRSAPWSTPMSDHRDVGGLRLPTRGDLVWKLPEGDLTYGEFVLDGIELWPTRGK